MRVAARWQTLMRSSDMVLSRTDSASSGHFSSRQTSALRTTMLLASVLKPLMSRKDNTLNASSIDVMMIGAITVDKSTRRRLLT